MSEDKKSKPAKPAKTAAPADSDLKSPEPAEAPEAGPPEKDGGAGTKPAPEAPAPAKKPEAPEVPAVENLGLKTVSAWAASERLAGWQLAALLRSTGWTADKKVDRSSFRTYLKTVLGRRMGGY